MSVIFFFLLSNYSIFSPNRNYNHSNVALCLKILLPNVRINTCNTYILELPSELCVEISSKVHRRDSSHFKNSRTNCALNGMAFLVDKLMILFEERMFGQSKLYQQNHLPSLQNQHPKHRARKLSVEIMNCIQNTHSKSFNPQNSSSSKLQLNSNWCKDLIKLIDWFRWPF